MVSIGVTGFASFAEAAERVSVRGGVQANAASFGSVTDASGTCVAFYSDASNLLPQVGGADTNRVRDVFVYDRSTAFLERVSVSSSGVQANGPSQAQGFLPAIDAICSCVAFSSDATNLVADDTNLRTDVFLRDLAAGTTERVSIGANGEEANGISLFPGVSSDCEMVSFQSVADNLVDDDTNGVSDIFVYNRTTGEATRVNVSAAGEQANGTSIAPSISADGRCVAFASAATNLLGSDTNRRMDIYVACDGAVTCRASVNSNGGEANQDSFLPSISADGRLVAFKSFASNLVPGDTNAAADVFIHDCVSGETEIVSLTARGDFGDDNSFPPSISGDGRFVAFGSFASNLIGGVSTRGQAQIYVRDRELDTIMLISANPAGRPGNGSVPDMPPSISLDGSFVAFASLASDLVPNDTNGVLDAFIGFNPTATPSPTPTALPCEDDDDCPPGQTCMGNVCRAPTPTPTPTIRCVDDDDCPDPQQCVDGICRLPCDDDDDCPGELVCINDFCVPPPPTATPTPTRVPCFTDQDCPFGQVCEDDSCVPAPTPTPTIRCTTDDDCPDPLVCIDRVCRDLSTPTPTPTPLPPCMTDEDCEPPAHCRAMVCVPPRSCDDSDPAVDRLQCRGSRETCVGGLCECGGDCNRDGIVFGNEITTGVNILGGVAPISVCPAADITFPLDDVVTGNEITIAVLNLGLGCPGEGLPLELIRDRSGETRTLVIGSATAIRGGRVTVSVSLAGGADVATAQMDILYDAGVLSVLNPDTDCVIDSRLQGTHLLRAFSPQRPSTPPGQRRLRLFVGDLMFPVDTFGEGTLLRCTFEVNPNAAVRSTTLSGERLNIGDSAGNLFAAESTAGTVSIDPCGNDEQCPEGRVCRDGSCLPACEDDDDCPDPLRCHDGVCTPIQCVESIDCGEDMRETCVGGFCECTGDCNGDRIVTGNEITTAVRILGGLESLGVCAAADSNGDGFVFGNEVTLGVINLGENCPSRP